MNCEEAEELISPYLDGELLQFKAQLFENHIQQCERCRSALDKSRKLSAEMKSMQFAEPTQDELRAARPQIVIQVTRGLGWMLTLGVLVVMVGFGLYEFIVEPGVEALTKLLVLGAILGPTLLFVSVLHQRIVESKTDKYREVEK